MQVQVNNIYLGDCLELIKQLDDKSVDVCITSPPYGDIGKTEVNTESGNNPYGVHKKYINVESHIDDWFEWQCSIIDEMLRVSKKLVVYNIAGIKPNRDNVYKLIGHYHDKIHDIVIWYKPNGLPTCTPNSISNTYEYVILLRPDGVDSVKVNSTMFRNVMVNNVNSNNPYANIHHAVMPRSFCVELVKEFTQKGDVVLDPFSGMGTTAVSCVALDRNFIGFELCEQYYEESLKRIQSEQKKHKGKLF